MSLFKGNYAREGPGIPKNMPPKKGLRLFFDILLREFWELIKLNLTFLLACLPIITIPPAIGGMTYVVMKMVRDQPNFVWSDFWVGFKKNIKQAYLAGIFSLFLMASVIFSYLIAYSTGNTVFLVVGLICNFLAGITLIYLFPMIVTVDIPFLTAVKNSLLLGISMLHHSLPSLIIIEGLGILCVMFFVYALPALVLVAFSFFSLISCFAAWAGIKKFVIPDEDDESSE